MFLKKVWGSRKRQAKQCQTLNYADKNVEILYMKKIKMHGCNTFATKTKKEDQAC